MRVASKMFTALADEGINILMISTSEIKVSVIIDEKYLELAVRCLHTAFGLDREHGESSTRLILPNGQEFIKNVYLSDNNQRNTEPL